MDVPKIFSKNSFRVVIFFVLVFILCLNIGIYFGIDWFLHNFSNSMGEKVSTKDLYWLIDQFALASQYFYTMILPATAGSILLMGWIFWLVLKKSMSSTFEYLQENPVVKKNLEKKKKDFVDQKIEEDRKRRLFLHSLSVLQREGRLLDFFDEDLSLYNDEQIGAAVRSIQEDCKKAVKKYIDPKPVMESQEGDVVTVDAGFDIDSIKLIGSVAGEPPFKGILRHRGWKAGKKEIPKLSDIQDAAIITPAEVEIQ